MLSAKLEQVSVDNIITLEVAMLFWFLIYIIRRPFFYCGLALLILAFMMGTEAVAAYHTMGFRLRENYLFFASSFFFLGFMTLAVQTTIEAENLKQKATAGLIFTGNAFMAGWVLVGPFVGWPFLGLAPFTLPL